MAKKIDFRLLLDRLSHISLDFSTITQYAWLLNLFVIFVLAKTISDMAISTVDSKITIPPPVAKKIAPVAEPRLYPPLGEFGVILKRNIFNPNAKEEELMEPVKKRLHTGLDEAGAVLTSLPLQLIGTIILSDSKRSVAAIRNSEKDKLESYQSGNMIDTAARIHKVEAQKVYLQNIATGQLEYIELKEDQMAIPVGASPYAPLGKGIREAGEDRFVIDRGMMEGALTNPNEILTQARAVPNIVGGKIQGFRIFAIRPDSIYEKLGIKNGDVILRVNGIDLDSPAKALEFYGAISSASDITLDIDRGGQKRSFSYAIR